MQVLDQVRRERGFKLVGYVAMPEHVHLLIWEPERATPSTVLKMLKQRVSRRLRRRSRAGVSAAQGSFEFAPANGRLSQFWHRRFYDFNVWSRRRKIEKLHYMHANPLRRGLVEDPSTGRGAATPSTRGEAKRSSAST